MKSFARSKARNRSGRRIAGGDSRNGFEVLPNQFYIQVRPEGLQARFIDMHTSRKKMLLGAIDNDAGVYELLALDPGHDAKDSVIK